jgi:hypothetical protein
VAGSLGTSPISLRSTGEENREREIMISSPAERSDVGEGDRERSEAVEGAANVSRRRHLSGRSGNPITPMASGGCRRASAGRLRAT